jgi:hypothetical protein
MKRTGFFILLFIITLTVFDSCKKNKDTNAPVITILGDNPLTVPLGQPYVDPGATAYDQEDGDITDKIKTTIDVNTDVEGYNYHVYYNVQDNAGNKAVEAVRSVHVLQF